MLFVCNGTSGERLTWQVLLTKVTAFQGALDLANGQVRIVTEDATNDDNPSNITVLDAMLEDSNTTITCRDGASSSISDMLTVFVEGEYLYVYVCT